MIAQLVPRSSQSILTSCMWVRIPLATNRNSLDEEGKTRARNILGLTWKSKYQLAVEIEQGRGRRAMGDAGCREV